MNSLIRRGMTACASIMIWLLAAQSHAGEKLSGTNIDFRTLIFLQAPDASVQNALPEGWEISPPPKGPFKDFNLVLVLIDGISALDADAKPVPPFKGVVIAVPARETGKDNRGVMVVSGIASAGSMPGAYGVYKAGQVEIFRQKRISSEEESVSEEKWAATSADKNSISVHLKYEHGASRQSDIKTKAHSGAKPEFFRVYRGKQVTELLRSTVLDVNKILDIEVSASGPAIQAMFDGTEKLVGVLSIPSYVRSIYLPE